MATKAGEQDEARAASKTRAPSQKIHERLRGRFGDEVVTLVDAVDPYTVVEDATRFIEVMTFLRDDPELRFDFLRSVSGVDYPDAKKIASVYHLYSYDKGHAHVVKYLCDRESPEVPTVERLWPTATWFERENYDLLGIIYLGHHDLRRIMLPDDWMGHPLRKDYGENPQYRGIGTSRASPLEAFKQMDENRRKAREERGEPPPAVRTSPIKAPEDPTKKADDAAAKKPDAAAAVKKPEAGAAAVKAADAAPTKAADAAPTKAPDAAAPKAADDEAAAKEAKIAAAKAAKAAKLAAAAAAGGEAKKAEESPKAVDATPSAKAENAAPAESAKKPEEPAAKKGEGE